MSRQYYNPPQELPAGLLETLQPLASWVKAQLTAAYMAGYRDGRGDAAHDYAEIARRSADTM